MGRGLINHFPAKYKTTAGNANVQLVITRTKSEKDTDCSGVIYIKENRKIHAASLVPRPDIETGNNPTRLINGAEARIYQNGRSNPRERDKSQKVK